MSCLLLPLQVRYESLGRVGLPGPVLHLSDLLKSMLPVQVLVDVLFDQSSHGHSGLLPLRVCLHLLDVRLLLHATLFVVLALVFEAFLDLSLAESDSLRLSHFLHRCVLGCDVVVCGKTALLH